MPIHAEQLVFFSGFPGDNLMKSLNDKFINMPSNANFIKDYYDDYISDKLEKIIAAGTKENLVDSIIEIAGQFEAGAITQHDAEIRISEVRTRAEAHIAAQEAAIRGPELS